VGPWLQAVLRVLVVQPFRGFHFVLLVLLDLAVLLVQADPLVPKVRADQCLLGFLPVL
jgi:hypothetical protein